MVGFCSVLYILKFSWQLYLHEYISAETLLVSSESLWQNLFGFFAPVQTQTRFLIQQSKVITGGGAIPSFCKVASPPVSTGYVPLHCVSAMPAEQIRFTLLYALIPTRSAVLHICFVPASAARSPPANLYFRRMPEHDATI